MIIIHFNSNAQVQPKKSYLEFHTRILDLEKKQTELVEENTKLKHKLQDLEDEMDTLKIKTQSSEDDLSDNRIAIDLNSGKLDVLELELNDIHENLEELNTNGKFLTNYIIIRILRGKISHI